MREIYRKRVQTLLESLPWIRMFSGTTMVIKYGGAAMCSADLKDEFATDIALLRYVGIKPIIVHGGGNEISSYMKRLDLTVKFVDGLRVTDAAAMEVAKMVLVGKVNKEIVSLINSKGAAAVGLCGNDKGDPALNILLEAGRVVNVPVERMAPIYVFGQVRNPGALQVKRSSVPTLTQAIAQAGGFTDRANRKKVQIRRKDASGKELTITVNVRDILKGKKKDIPLMIDDTVYVPESLL